MSVLIEKNNQVWTIIINRPEARNAVDGPTAQALTKAFREFDAADDAAVAVLYGEGGTFCAGADLKAVSGEPERANSLSPEGDGPMGPSRLLLTKPVIAAVEGHAVAGGLELACWCDLRVAAADAVFGVFCRRFGVPLIDGGTIRLPRLIGHSRALDMILTGRPVTAEEALTFGLANRVVASGTARQEAEALAAQLLQFPQRCLREDRLSSYEQWTLPLEQALDNEFRRGMSVVQSGETVNGATAFSRGQGRGGKF